MANKVYVGQEGAQELYRRVKDLIPAVDQELDENSSNPISNSAVTNAFKKFGGYRKVNGTGADNHPDVQNPDSKVIYLVEDPNAPDPDHFYEWIWEVPAEGNPIWRCIGTATMDLEDYYTKAEVDAQLDEKVDKVTGATEGHLAGLDAFGNLTDSGSKSADFATAEQGAVADTAVQSVRIGQSGSELKDGTSVVIPVATTSVSGVTVLSSDVDSDSVEAAATSLAVKNVRDELSGLVSDEAAARVSGLETLSQAIADEATRARNAEDGIVTGYTAFKRGGANKNFMKIARLTSSMASTIGGVSSVYLSFDIYMFDTVYFGPSVGTYSGKFWIDDTGALSEPEGTQSFVVRTMDDTGTAVTRPYSSIRCVLSGAEISVWLEIDRTMLPSSLVPVAICTANKAVRKDGTAFNNPFSFADGMVTGVDASEVPTGGVVIYPVSVASMQAVNGKANLVSGATEGNLAAIGADGNLVDSTMSVSDFATKDELPTVNDAKLKLKLGSAEAVDTGFTANADTDATIEIPVMSGATSLEAGGEGLVPAPTTSDKDKFLKGDGTWGEAASAVRISYDAVNEELQLDFS